MDAGISTSNSFDHLQQVDKDDRITISELGTKRIQKDSSSPLSINAAPVHKTSEAVLEHPLEHSWSFWFLRRVQGAKSQDNYEKNVKKIATLSSVEGFWGYYNHLLRPNDLPITSDYHLFKDNIRPLWERSKQIWRKMDGKIKERTCFTLLGRAGTGSDWRTI